MVFQIAELGIAHLAARVRADRFEDVLNRDVVILESSWRYGAAIDHEPRYVESCERHDGAGNGFVAAREGDHAVKEIAARDEFDGVSDYFSRDKRGLHAFAAHGDAVGD